MKKPAGARVYDVRRMDTSEDAAEAAALGRASRVLEHPVIVQVIGCGIAADGVPLVQYVMEEST